MSAEDMYQTLTAHLRRQAQAAPARTALINVVGNTVQKLTFGQFYEQACRVAGWLRQQGIGKPDRGLIIMENRPEWPLSYFGLLLAGGTAVPVDLQSRPEHLAYVLEQTRANLVFASAKAPLPEIAHGAVGPTPGGAGRATLLPVTQTVDFGELLASPAATALPAAQLDDLASIIYTSGTTGLPKGVMLTQKNFAANYRGIAAWRPSPRKTTFWPFCPCFMLFRS